MMLVISVSGVAAEGAFSLQNNIKPNAKSCSGKDLTQKKAPPSLIAFDYTRAVQVRCSFCLASMTAAF